MANVTVVIGAGSIGQAIARRVSAGKRILLADLRQGRFSAGDNVLFVMTGGTPGLYAYRETFQA